MSGISLNEEIVLTPREEEILRLIVGGKTNNEMADELGISPKTVGVHRANLMRKLRVHKAVELVMYAFKSGIAE